ncbi:5'-methylthioadenosine/adenosylhomocysteine nucleosidase [Deinococcus humi]|uniref:adenosylhomocysteine nucleosidase n=1 Tax=Deinococcus humi TaxID=662880 RepID=A0A7W8JRJ5_9DEIO|nr:5'-methylthioadenosine/adenosylhomocysteine nucleosidase [Deinococcus humi]MBB5361917.1 adenosylhomocysteine nucleosidase [Deinococcus humi]GGO22994.1 5'-methylthioadenosine/S-adenosylhomocysteine nucleosidase [Deinococcus humi]
MLAIIGAMDEEIELLLSDLQGRQELAYPGATLYRGQLDGVTVLLTRGGIGKVNAALTTAHLLAAGASRIIFTGVAGGVHPELRVGDIVVSTDCVQHDVDVTALGYPVGTVPGEAPAWAADDTLRGAAVQAAQEVSGVRVIEGRVASGDQFIASPEGVRRLQSVFDAACAEMEGAAVAQVCAKAGIPFVIIRSVSDTADGSASVDYREFMPQVARHAKAVVRGMLARLTAQDDDRT